MLLLVDVILIYVALFAPWRIAAIVAAVWVIQAIVRIGKGW